MHFTPLLNSRMNIRVLPGNRGKTKVKSAVNTQGKDQLLLPRVSHIYFSLYL